MSLRKGLLAVFAGVAVAGAASAGPPVEPATFGSGVGPAIPAEASRAVELGAGWVLPALRDLFLDGFTMPLGTVPMWD
jgi:hypothetical protein